MVPFNTIPGPQKLALTVTLGNKIANRWEFTSPENTFQVPELSGD
jgi:hypothetical protein